MFFLINRFFSAFSLRGVAASMSLATLFFSGPAVGDYDVACCGRREYKGDTNKHADDGIDEMSFHVMVFPTEIPLKNPDFNAESFLKDCLKTEPPENIARQIFQKCAEFIFFGRASSGAFDRAKEQCKKELGFFPDSFNGFYTNKSGSEKAGDENEVRQVSDRLLSLKIQAADTPSIAKVLWQEYAPKSDTCKLVFGTFCQNEVEKIATKQLRRDAEVAETFLQAVQEKIDFKALLQRSGKGDRGSLAWDYDPKIEQWASVALTSVTPQVARKFLSLDATTEVCEYQSSAQAFEAFFSGKEIRAFQLVSAVQDTEALKQFLESKGLKVQGSSVFSDKNLDGSFIDDALMEDFLKDLELRGKFLDFLNSREKTILGSVLAEVALKDSRYQKQAREKAKKLFLKNPERLLIKNFQDYIDGIKDTDLDIKVFFSFTDLGGWLAPGQRKKVQAKEGQDFVAAYEQATKNPKSYIEKFFENSSSDVKKFLMMDQWRRFFPCCIQCKKVRGLKWHSQHESSKNLFQKHSINASTFFNALAAELEKNSDARQMFSSAAKKSSFFQNQSPDDNPLFLPRPVYTRFYNLIHQDDHFLLRSFRLVYTLFYNLFYQGESQDQEGSNEQQVLLSEKSVPVDRFKKAYQNIDANPWAQTVDALVLPDSKKETLKNQLGGNPTDAELLAWYKFSAFFCRDALLKNFGQDSFGYHAMHLNFRNMSGLKTPEQLYGSLDESEKQIVRGWWETLKPLSVYDPVKGKNQKFHCSPVTFFMPAALKKTLGR